MSTWTQIEAEKAFGRAARARRRALLACRVGLRRACGCGTLAVHDGIPARAGAATPTRVREIDVDAISATVEPNRAAHGMSHDVHAGAGLQQLRDVTGVRPERVMFAVR